MLLSNILRCWLQGEPLPLAPPGITESSTPLRLNGTLYHIALPLSEAEQNKCAQEWNENLGAHLRRLEILRRCWPVSAPPPLIFKGADLGEHLYDDPGARRAYDLDLLLPRPAFESIIPQLSTQASEVREAHYERFPGEPQIVLGFLIEGCLLELHSDPQPPHRPGPRGLALWHRAELRLLQGFRLKIPRPLDRLLLWLSNCSKDGGYLDLLDLLDFVLIRRTLSQSWSELRQSVKLYGLERAFDLALLRLKEAELWPGGSLPEVEVTILSRLLPGVLQAPENPNPFLFQGSKLFLCPPELRWGLLRRTLSSLSRFKAKTQAQK